MARIGIVGSGNLGGNIAFFLAERDVADVVLFDLQAGLSTGKALDMMEAAPVRSYRTKISGTDEIEEALDSKVCVLAAGSVRQPGSSREELLSTNRSVVAEVAAKMKSYEGVVIVATEPIDALTTLFVRDSGLDPSRVLGLGGFLDSTRLRYLIAKELGISAEGVTALVIGQHSDSMLPLADYCKVSGIPVATLIDESRLAELFEATKHAGGRIVELARRTSAFYGPSAAASDLCSAIVNDSRRIVSVSVLFSGQYEIDGVAMSLPAVVGEAGAVRILEPALSERERSVLKSSAAAIARAVEE